MNTKYKVTHISKEYFRDIVNFNVTNQTVCYSLFEKQIIDHDV